MIVNLASALAPAVRVDPAYDDIDRVRELVQRESPYPVIATLYGYANMYGGIGEKTFPWYRSYWALDGKPVIVDPGAEAILHHEPFIQAARRIFAAEVVRPQTLLVNLMAPMEIGAPHMDAPSFRGLQRDEFPIWLVVAMGASGLFERWSVSVAGAISWLYDGLAGEFEYWPEGPDHASRLEPAPFHNVALVSDNDRMYHRVREIGTLAARKSLGDVPTASEMRWSGAAWEITCDDHVIAAYAPEAMRISLLWKAMVFRDAADAARFDDHSDDIEIGQIVDIFRADLDARGVDYEAPTDPLEDPQWAATLNRTYRI